MADFTLSEDSKKIYRGIFESKDVTETGTLNRKEFEECLYVCGFNPTLEDLEFLKKHFDKDGDGKLSIDELVDNLDIINVHSIHGDQLMESFQKIDTAGDGYIRKNELTCILTAKGPHQMGKEEARELVNSLMEEFDINRDGKLSYSEFCKMFIKDAVPMI